jgi:IS5 family transposase
MRKPFKPQPGLREPWLELEHCRELEAISAVLDAHPKINELVLQELRSSSLSNTSLGDVDVGCGGMSAEQVLRAAIVKQMNQFSYRELAFHLADSRSYRTFCRLGIMEPTPSKSTLAANIKALTSETLEKLNRELVNVAEKAAIEKGKKVRVDCTVVESNIHPPADSELLYDCVRVVTRLMCRARELLGTVVVYGNRTRRAKRRRLGVLNAKDKHQRRRVYRDLLKVTEETYGCGRRVAQQLEQPGLIEPEKRARAERIASDLKHFLVLTRKVIDQTRRRVIDEERVPAQDKVVSIFEEHTDIIRKDRRETLYGHKVCLTGGSSSMILDCVILDGNPADSTLAETMIERQIEIYERAPRQVAYDGAFSSKANLEAIKGKGVEDVAFAKAHGFTVTDMVKSSWVYQRLRRFRCGIEGVISFLKRVFGLNRCSWRSLPSFKSYVWTSIITCNLLVMARHLIQ